MFTTPRRREALVEYLASREAAEIWAKRGGFTAPNKKVPPSAYPDAITRTTADAIGEGQDLPRSTSPTCSRPSFGATVGQGEFKIFQDFLKNPSDVERDRVSSSSPRPRRPYKAGK